MNPLPIERQPPSEAEPPAPGDDFDYLEVREAFLAHRPSQTQGIVLLGSLVLFVLSLAATGTWAQVAFITLAVFIHEAGHWLGMRVFGFRDVRMFFIPFFGAAVAGRRAGAAGWKEAIVLLLGPLPGLILGSVLLLIGSVWASPIVSQAAWVFLAINAFNLLPFVPLDGGHVNLNGWPMRSGPPGSPWRCLAR